MSSDTPSALSPRQTWPARARACVTYVALNRHGKNAEAVVVNVLADQVHPPRCAASKRGQFLPPRTIQLLQVSQTRKRRRRQRGGDRAHLHLLEPVVSARRPGARDDGRLSGEAGRRDARPSSPPQRGWVVLVRGGNSREVIRKWWPLTLGSTEEARGGSRPRWSSAFLPAAVTPLCFRVRRPTPCGHWAHVGGQQGWTEGATSVLGAVLVSPACRQQSQSRRAAVIPWEKTLWHRTCRCASPTPTTFRGCLGWSQTCL